MADEKIATESANQTAGVNAGAGSTASAADAAGEHLSEAECKPAAVDQAASVGTEKDVRALSSMKSMVATLATGRYPVEVNQAAAVGTDQKELKTSTMKSMVATSATGKQELQDFGAKANEVAVISDTAEVSGAAMGTDKHELKDPVVVNQAAAVGTDKQDLKASSAKSEVAAVGTEKQELQDPAVVNQAAAVGTDKQELKASSAKSEVAVVGTEKHALKDGAVVNQATAVSTDAQDLKASSAMSKTAAVGTDKQELEDPGVVNQPSAVGTDQKDPGMTANAMAAVSSFAKVSGAESLAASAGHTGAPVPPAVAAAQPAKVEFVDTEGRACLFKLNTSGSLDYYVDGRHKGSQIKQLEPVGNRVSFDGKRIMSKETQATIREEDSDEVIAKLMDLANKAHDASAGDTNAIRCIVHVERAEGLRAADDCGTSDPYVVVTIPGKPKSSDQTTHKRRTLDPTWNEYVEVHDYEKGDELEIRVMDYDYLTSDDWLGTVTISGKDLANKRFQATLALGDDKKHGAEGKLVKGTLAVQVWIATNVELSGELATELQVAMTGLSGREIANDLDNEDSLSRRDVIKGLIAVLFGKTANVTSAEVRTFAECYGFHGDADEWACEFRELCKLQQWESGPDLEQFAGWIDDDIMFVDDLVLGEVLDELKRRSESPNKRPRYLANTWQTSDSTDDMITRKPREILVKEAFSALTGDAGAGGTMGSDRLKDYARFCGFDGSEEEWQIEYAELLDKYEFSQLGPNFEQFCNIVDGNDDESTRCGDGELRELIDMFRSPGGEGRVWQSTLRDQIWLLHPKTVELRAGLPREDLIQRYFNIYDENGDGFLGPDELRKFADISGWRGDDEDWAIQYGEMVNDFNLNPRKGADFKQFEKIVDKKAGQSKIEAQDLVSLIEDTAIAHSYIRKRTILESQGTMGKVGQKSNMSRSYTKHLSRALGRKKTWVAVSKNYEILRSFGVFLRHKYVDTDQAFLAFSTRPFGRLTKFQFLGALNRLGFDGQGESLFRLLALGGLYIFKRHIKWSWNLLHAEGIVKARAKSRGTRRTMISSMQEDM